jgi:Clp amino terminal domain, pathogenicity island component
MFERFDPDARKIVVLAQEEARLLNHNYIGTEHLLLGLIRDGDGVAARALASLGVELEQVRDQVVEIIGVGDEQPVGQIPFTPRSKKVLELSLRQALQLNHNYIGTEHILLGLLAEGEGVAAQVLVKLGADLVQIRHRVVQILDDAPRVVSGATLGNVMVRPAMNPLPGRCALCNRDLWETDRYVTGELGSVCDDCLRVGTAAVNAADAHGELMMPPRVFGDEPHDGATEAIVRAFQAVFGGPLWRDDTSSTDNLEDGDTLAPYLAEAAQRHASIQILGARVSGVRYLGPDEASVRYGVRISQMGQPMPFEGQAVRRGGRWLVSR